MQILINAIAKLVVIAGAFLAIPQPALAERYPDKPVTIIVPASPGGGIDIVARIFAEKLTKRWDVPVLVLNLAGADGEIASRRLAAAAPDGHTLLIQSSLISTNQAFNPSNPYHPLRDFTPIALVASTPLVLAVNSGLAIDSIGDLVNLSRNKPGGLFYSTASTVVLLWGEHFKSEAGIKATPIPYKGSAPSTTALATGEVQYTLDTLGPLAPYLQSGKVKLIAAATPNRISSLPTLPTLTELGIKGMDKVAPRGIFGPKGLPSGIVDKVGEDLRAVTKDPEVEAKLKALGIDVNFMGRDKFRQFLTEELALYVNTIKIHNLKK